MSTLVLLVLLAGGPEATVMEDAPLWDHGERVRFGFSTQGGFQTLGEVFTIDADLRLGRQVTQWWSAYAIARFYWALNSQAGGAVGAALEVMASNIVSFAVAPLFFFTVVNSFDGTTFIGERTNTATFKPGFDVKLAISTGKSRPPLFNRPGMTIGFELIGMLALDLVNRSTFRGATPTPLAPTWIFTPMVSLGFDFR